METLLIGLLLLYNAWLVTYILFGKRKNNDTQTMECLPSKSPKKEDGIVGKSRFKMENRTPISAKPTPNTAIYIEGEDITDIATTFADEEDETPSARLPDDKIDEAFEDIRNSDVPREYENDGGERPTAGYATGESFEEMDGALKVADNPLATLQERKKAGQIFTNMDGDELFHQIMKNNPERAKRISGLMDEILNKPISGEGGAAKVSLHPRNRTEVKVPDDINGFDIRDFV